MSQGAVAKRHMQMTKEGQLEQGSNWADGTSDSRHRQLHRRCRQQPATVTCSQLGKSSHVQMPEGFETAKALNLHRQMLSEI